MEINLAFVHIVNIYLSKISLKINLLHSLCNLFMITAFI